MKKHIIIAISLLTLAACTKKSSSTSSSTSTLNATETSLIGTWYLQKEQDSIGHVDYSGYSTSNYIQFTSTVLNATTGYLTFNDGCLIVTDIVQPPANVGVATVLWYYNATTNFLVLNTIQFTIVSLSSSSLILNCQYAGGNKYWYFSK